MGQTSVTLSCIFLCFLVAPTVLQVESANIAFFFGISTYSHRIPAWPLATGLADLGHNVTFISPFPAKKPHPKVFDYAPPKLKEWVDSWEDMEDVFAERKAGDLLKGWISLPDYGIAMCEVIYSDEEFVKWVKTSKFDLVFIDALFNDCGYGMAHVFEAKVIQFATSTAPTWYSEAFGIPDESSWLPDMVMFFDPNTVTFKQRLTNALLPIAWDFVRRWSYFPKLEKITRDGLGITDLPKFEEIERNVSLVFVNTHYGEEFARSLPPNIVSIGGIAYVEKRTPLPKDLAAFLEKGNGFIYISFGTYADFQKMDAPTQNAIIRAMQSFPELQFVWKVGNDTLLKNFPKGNVYISNWMPQQDILAHPKIKAFITHSGLIGIQESIYNAVPLISFPIFAEQDYNAERVHRKEYGIKLEITTVTKAELEDAISKVVTDPKYRDNMKKVSRMFSDRIQTPLQTALWWTDFVLTHSQKDLEALKPLSRGQSWWVRRQLDVWITLLGLIAIIVVSIFYIPLKILKYLCCASTTAVKSKEIRADRKKKVQ
ncbi:UDP-glucuronosyltransferase 1-7C [Orchesella cincta]|uniref:UDP-glucuronosyltransferase 1-7C n=1 Tax=Orchesella cincta TaxID=48709 RepID=A0A1D2M4L8_ORCCI|nr:UDP-glucuronosyltransferase 1-7C [Orchesella cincta]